MGELEAAERAVIDAAVAWCKPFINGEPVPNVHRITSLAAAVSALVKAREYERLAHVTDHAFQKPRDGGDWCVEAVQITGGHYGACYRKRADHPAGGR